MTIARILLAALLTWSAAVIIALPGAAVDREAPFARSPAPNPGPGPNIKVCKHAGPNLPPQLVCVEEVEYRRCGCDNSCQRQHGRPPQNTDPHWDAKPLNTCLTACGRVEARERAACFRK